MYNMLVNCAHCRTPLQIPPGAESIRCAICQGVTLIADPRGLPQPPASHAPPPPAPYSHAPPPPAPYSHAPPGPPPNAHGRKKAVICGISYKYSRHELKGCINDAKCMRYLLINKFQFPEDCIVMLTEEETHPSKIPNKYNIRMALYWLVQGCQAGDSLFFHYSGHGSRQRNYNGDEVDGYDETLCPLDFETQGMIVDDEINAAIVRPIPPGAKLHAIIDACHSGTVLDLPFLCRMDRSGRYVWEDHRPRSGMWKGSGGGEVISFSGCDDDQTSADTSALSKITSTGAMTFCFIQAIERGQAGTYGSILNSMRSTIRSTGTGGGGGGSLTSLLGGGGGSLTSLLGGGGGGGGGAVTSLVSMLVTGGSDTGGLKQEPQLTACEPFDVLVKSCAAAAPHPAFAPTHSRSPSFHSRAQIAELDQVFKKFDVNGDGKISSSELGAIMSSLGQPASDEELNGMISEVDSDGDGFINFKEFAELNTKGIDPAEALENLKDAFSVYDIDGNGSISVEELYKVLRSLGDECSMDECRKMIGGVDSDGDGMINFEEFKVMMMTGSRYTDPVSG